MFKILHKATRFLHFCRTVKIFHLATSEQKFRIVVILNFAHFGHQYTETSIIRCKNWTPFWILSLLQTYYYFVSDHDFSWILEFWNNQFDGSSGWRIVTIGCSKKITLLSFKWLKKLHTSTPKLDQWLHRKFQLDTRTVTHLIWSLMESSSTELKKHDKLSHGLRKNLKVRVSSLFKVLYRFGISKSICESSFKLFKNVTFWFFNHVIFLIISHILSKMKISTQVTNNLKV